MISSFHVWEVAAEIRANVDYLLGAIEIYNFMAHRYGNKCKRTAESSNNSDKKQRHNKTSPQAEEASVSRYGEDNALGGESTVDDILCVLMPKWQEGLIQSLLRDDDHLIFTIQGMVERDMSSHMPSSGCLLDSNHKQSRSSCAKPRSVDKAECCILALSIISWHVLSHRIHSISAQDAASLIQRPWLRHLTWEVVLSYVLWDCIAVIEKWGLSLLACGMLQTVLGWAKMHEILQLFAFWTLKVPWKQVDSLCFCFPEGPEKRHLNALSLIWGTSREKTRPKVKRPEEQSVEKGRCLEEVRGWYCLTIHAGKTGGEDYILDTVPKCAFWFACSIFFSPGRLTRRGITHIFEATV